MRILYINEASGRNRELAKSAVAMLGGAEWHECGQDGFFHSPSADLAIVDCWPTDLRRFLIGLASCSSAVVCVPPLAGNGPGADRLFRMAKRNRLVLLPLQTARFHPGFASVLEIVGSGVTGRTARVSCSRRGVYPMLPQCRGGLAGPETHYWEKAFFASLGAEEDICELRIVPDGSFSMEMEVRGENGAVLLRQEEDDEACRYTVRTTFHNARGRERNGSFSHGLPLATEVGWLIKEGIGAWRKRDIRKAVAFEAGLTPSST